MARSRQDHPPGAAFGGRLSCNLCGVLAVVELSRHRSLLPVRVDVDDVVHAHVHLLRQLGRLRAGPITIPLRPATLTWLIEQSREPSALEESPDIEGRGGR